MKSFFLISKLKRFDSVYGESEDQMSIFKEVNPMIDQIFEGFNTTIFCYGITSSGKKITEKKITEKKKIKNAKILGKTYTMQGNNRNPGIIPNTGKKLFNELLPKYSENETECNIYLSYVEIYNEKIFDLLDTKNVDLPIREDKNKNIIIPGLTKLKIENYQDFSEIYEKGCNNRTTGKKKKA